MYERRGYVSLVAKAAETSMQSAVEDVVARPEYAKDGEVRNCKSTSNKKHFMKNVKECRDVIVKKVLEQGWDTRTTHYTHVGPMTLHRCHQLHDLYCLFV